MSGTTVVFCDIVGFSKMDAESQEYLVMSLSACAANQLYSELREPLHRRTVIVLPTGDGMAIAFTDNKDGLRTTVFELVVGLMAWTLESRAQLRVGVHTGVAKIVQDINGQANLCGDTINYCQRVMDAANDNQVLFSEQAYRTFVGQGTVEISGHPFCETEPAVFSEAVSVLAKHGARIPVHVMWLTDSHWTQDEPLSKGHMLSRLTKLPKEIEGSFASSLTSAEEVALIQLTGHNLLPKLEEGKDVVFSPELKRLMVFMPDADAYGALVLDDSAPTVEEIRENADAWRKYLRSLKTQRPGIVIKLGLFKSPPYFGASYLDWSDPERGRIHVSPYVWGLKAKDCPGMDYEWGGGKKPMVYDAYVRGLNHLDAVTTNALDEPE